MSIIIEHFAGAFPLWLAPEQVRVLTIGDQFGDYAHDVASKLVAAGLRAELDNTNESIGKKIREAQLQKIPYMLVIGGKEVEANAVAVRSRDGVDMGVMSVDELIAKLGNEG